MVSKWKIIYFIWKIPNAAITCCDRHQSGQPRTFYTWDDVKYRRDITRNVLRQSMKLTKMYVAKRGTGSIWPFYGVVSFVIDAESSLLSQVHEEY